LAGIIAVLNAKCVEVWRILRIF